MTGAGLPSIAPGILFGPCSGNDMPLAFHLAGHAINDFAFCDLHYSTQTTSRGVVPPDWSLLSREVEDHQSQTSKRTWYLQGESFVTELVKERWQRRDCSEVAVEIRRDKAEDVLERFRPASISVFVHVKDSPGEGGSDLWFLGSPVSSSGGSQRLLDRLVSRLAEGALVVTDGSLADEEFRGERPFGAEGRRWAPVSKPQVDKRYNRIKIWRVSAARSEG